MAGLKGEDGAAMLPAFVSSVLLLWITPVPFCGFLCSQYVQFLVPPHPPREIPTCVKPPPGGGGAGIL